MKDMAGIPGAMTVARMHEVGGELRIEQTAGPRNPARCDVLVRVRSCGIVPNLGNILANWTTWYPEMPLPPLPAIFGLDPAGEIAAVGDRVHNLKPGDRVYVNPLRTCGSCRHCRKGDPRSCRHAAFQGYFGFSEHALQTFADYDTGGLGEYMVAPASAIVSAARDHELRPRRASGLHGHGLFGAEEGAGRADATRSSSTASPARSASAAWCSGSAMGVKKILGTGRDRKLLWECQGPRPAPHRGAQHRRRPDRPWARSFTENGEGVDAFIDCNGPGAAHETLPAGHARAAPRRPRGEYRRASPGRPDRRPFHDGQQPALIGSHWFTTEEGQEMADMVGSGVADFSCLETHAAPLSRGERGDLGHRQAARRVLQLRHLSVTSAVGGARGRCYGMVNER